MAVDGHQQNDRDEAARELPGHAGVGRILRAVVLEEDREKCRAEGGQQPEDDPEAVLRVEVKDQVDPEDRKKRNAELFETRTAPMKERLENCREEADRRKGDDPDRDVARFDRGVKKRPLQHQERSHAHDAETVELFDGVELLGGSGPEPDESARDDDAPEDDEAGRQGDELAEDARPPRKQDREVELNEGFGYGIHGRVRLVLLECLAGLRPRAQRGGSLGTGWQES